MLSSEGDTHTHTNMRCDGINLIDSRASEGIGGEGEGEWGWGNSDY